MLITAPSISIVLLFGTGRVVPPSLCIVCTSLSWDIVSPDFLLFERCGQDHCGPPPMYILVPGRGFPDIPQLLGTGCFLPCFFLPFILFTCRGGT